MSNGDANELFLFHGTSQLPSMSVLEHYDGSGTGLPSMRAGAPGPTLRRQSEQYHVGGHSVARLAPLARHSPARRSPGGSEPPLVPAPDSCLVRRRLDPRFSAGGFYGRGAPALLRPASVAA